MSDETRARVQEVIGRLGYRVNVSARNLNRNSTGVITLAVPMLTPPYLAELANRVIEQARSDDYLVSPMVGKTRKGRENCFAISTPPCPTD